jgi:hypothetical protein
MILLASAGREIEGRARSCVNGILADLTAERNRSAGRAPAGTRPVRRLEGSALRFLWIVSQDSPA